MPETLLLSTFEQEDIGFWLVPTVETQFGLTTQDSQTNQIKFQGKFLHKIN